MPAIWITGLPGSGKSTYAEELKRRRPDYIILRMDALRKIATPEPTYSDSERDILYRSLIFTAKALSDAGHSLIIDATGNLRKWRMLARELLPGYIEVYLKCPIEVCIQRERSRAERHGAPMNIYEKGRSGWPVPGLTAPYEEPLNPEVTIDTTKTSVEEGIRLIEDAIRKKPG